MSLKKKLAFASVTVALFFVIFEACLAALGVGRVTDLRDPYVGFSSYMPLMQKVTNDSGDSVYRTANNKLVWFNPQSFPAEKPQGTRRVFCMGGSTTYGRPYRDETSFVGWLRELLPIVDNTTNWEVINAGGVSYASYRVAALMEEITNYEPDLFIVYSVHNEFLERRTYAGMFDQSQTSMDVTALLAKTRTWGLLDSIVHRPEKEADEKPENILPADVDEILNHTIGPADYHRDDKWRQSVLGHYQANLNRMIQIARDCGAKIVFVTATANEMDCTPFKSESSTDLSDQEQLSFDEFMSQGITAAARDDHEAAVSQFEQAMAIDAKHALVNYQIGKSLLALKRHEDAFASFRKALNEDVCPLRALDEINQHIRALAERSDVSIVDFEANLREKSKKDFGHEIFGQQYFLDHVHPNLEVHQEMATWIIDVMLKDGLASGALPDTEQIDSAKAMIMSRIDQYAQGESFRNLAKVLHWSGKFDEAAPRALDALQLIPGDPESMWVLADCQTHTGKTDEAMKTYDALFYASPQYFKGYLPYVELLMDQGKFEKAKIFASAVLDFYEPDSTRDYRVSYVYGVCCVSTEDYAGGKKALTRVLDGFPDDFATTAYLAMAHAGLGDVDKAIKTYRRAIEIDANDAWTRRHLGILLIKEQDFEGAITELAMAVKLDPQDQDAKAQLQIAKQLKGSEEE